jgi:hypothetical protein
MIYDQCPLYGLKFKKILKYLLNIEMAHYCCKANKYNCYPFIYKFAFNKLLADVRFAFHSKQLIAAFIFPTNPKN